MGMLAVAVTPPHLMMTVPVREYFRLQLLHDQEAIEHRVLGAA